MPKRRNIALSRRGLDHEGIEVFRSLPNPSDPGGIGEIMVIGGGELIVNVYPWQRLALSIVQADVEGDAWFPMLDGHQWGS